MSESTKAVFLSYASQDSEAAKRICEALRAAGVEVWFDQSELVGGDAWDAKIRKQIKECALLLPVISQTTQERREAYFRLEWKLADERTYLMAKGTPFLLPVTIDGTDDREALVPDSFLAVQWTRAPGGELPAAFAGRVRQLLGFGLSAGSSRSTPPMAPSGPADVRRRRWLKPALVVAVLAAGTVAAVFMARREARGSAAPAPAAASPVATGPRSAARELAERAREAAAAIGATAPALLAAAKDAERATTMDETDGELWAISALVDIALHERWIDYSDARRESINAKLVKAKGLAPDAPLTRFAEARRLVRVATSTASIAAGLKLLEALRQEKPAEIPPAEILATIGIAQQAQGRFAEAARTLDEAGPNWANAASWAWLLAGETLQAKAMAERQTSIDPVGGLQQEAYVQFSRGDLEAQQQVLDRLPPEARFGEVPLAMDLYFAYVRRDGATLLRLARGYPAPNVSVFYLPASARGFYVGQAYAWLGRSDAAREEWAAVLRQLDEARARKTESEEERLMRVRVLAHLERPTEAGEELRILRQRELGFWMHPSIVELLALLGRTDEALDEMERQLAGKPENRWLSHTRFRLDPALEPVRSHPRYKQILAAAMLKGAMPLEPNP